MTRDVVPQPVESRGFLRRRRSDDARSEEAVTPEVAPPTPVAGAPARVPVAMALAGPVAVHRPEPAPRPEPAIRAEPDELLRAKDALLQAALRQNEELSTALLNERYLRQQETERFTAENELLRDALAALNSDALARQQPQEATPSLAPLVLVPEQRLEPVLPVEPVVEEPEAVEPALPDVASRHGRRRSVRRAGPAEGAAPTS